MATATEPTHAGADGYVDFDEFIDYQIGRTRNGIKATDLLTALIGGAAAVLAYVLLFALFDHWVIADGFSTPARFALLSLLLIGLIGWTVWKLVLPYFRQVTPLYAAKQIELTQPDLQNTLLTLVDLKNSGRPVPESIEAALEKRSALNLSHMDIEQAIDRRLLMRLSYVLFALVVLTCGYVLFSPKKLSNSLWRAFLPSSSISVATRTRISNVEPGDVDVLARSQLQVTADISGEVPEGITLLFTTADHRFVDEPVAMRQTDETLRRFGGKITGENGAGILQNLTYRIVAGDAQSDSYSVSVTQPPSATVQEVRYEYPDYMGLSERTQPGGAIDAWEGTWVNIRATANLPLKSAMVMFSDTDDISQKAEEIPTKIENGTNITARWRMRIRSDGTYAGFYRVQCRNESGETDLDPTLYSIKIRPDQPPRIELAQPTGDIERPANAVVPLLYAAEDPDFLLRSVILNLELNGEALPQQPRLYQAPPFRRAMHDVYNLELESLELNSGDRLTYWLEARDNMEPFADRSGNRTNTPKLNITVMEPASPEDVQQQLEDDQQQVADRLEEARQEQQEQGREPNDSQPMDDDTPPPPANSDQPDEPGSEPPPQDGQEGTEQQDGEGGGTEGEQQQQNQGGGKKGGGQQQGPSDSGETGDETSPDGAGQKEGAEGTGEQPPGDQSFDDLLKQMMHREQQREKQDGTNPPDDQQPPQQPQTQPEDQQPPREGEQDQPQQQPGATGEKSENGESQKNDGTSGPSQSQPGTSEEGAPPSPGPGSPGQESMSDNPTPGEKGSANTPSKPGANDSPSTTPKPGDEEGGDAQPSDGSTSPDGKKPTNDTTSQDGKKQPGDDPTGAKPGGNDRPDAGKPQPAQTEGDEPMSDQPGPKPGEPLPNPDAKSGGQPDGPDEPLKGEGDPKGQKSDRPQTGEGGNSQETSQGNKGGEKPGPGDSTGEKGAQESAGEKTGQPGEGSEQKPGGEKTGAPSSESQDAKTGEQTDSSSQPGTGEQPEMSDTSPTGEPDAESQPAGEGQKPPSGDSSPPGETPGESPAGKGQPGQEPTGEGPSGEPGESPSPGGQPGQPGQPGSKPGSQPGDQPGTSPTGGSPSGEGGGTKSNGGEQLDGTSPDGMGGGGEGDAVDGEGTAGEGNGSGPKAEEADLAAKKKAANLVLDRLQEQMQRGEIDPKLQEELGVTQEQLREFTNKLEERLADVNGDDASPEAQARRRQFEETLRTVDYNSKGTTREGGDGPRESSSGFAGPNRQAPPKHRDAARQYRERLLQKQRSGR